MEVPKNLELEVTETAPGVKGNTVSGGTKSAKLETGAVIQVMCTQRAHVSVRPLTCAVHMLGSSGSSRCLEL